MRKQNKNKKQCRTTILKKRILIHVNFLNCDVNYQRKKQNIIKIKIRIKSETSKY